MHISFFKNSTFCFTVLISQRRFRLRRFVLAFPMLSLEAAVLLHKSSAILVLITVMFDSLWGCAKICFGEAPLNSNSVLKAIIGFSFFLAFFVAPSKRSLSFSFLDPLL